MKRYLHCAVILLFLSVLLTACGSDSDNRQTSSYTGDFLSWTGSADEAHYFTLVRVNGKTGAVTNIGGYNFFTALKYGADGTLYGINDGLYIIDPADGSSVKVGTFQYEGSGPIMMTGAAFSPTGTLYAVESNHRVFTVNLTNAALTYVGTAAALLWDIEFAPNGTMYGAFADLFTLNSADMSTISTVGRTGVNVAPLTFGSSGTLFGIDNYPSSHIYSISIENGSATLVVATGSIGLVPLVAERSSTPAANVKKAIALHGFSSPQSQEALLSKERQFRGEIGKNSPFPVNAIGNDEAGK